MKIEKFFPSVALMPFVKEFLIIESDLETGSNLLPDTSIVMAFRFMGNVQNEEGEKKEAIPANAITGLRRSARRLFYSRATANLLVVFNEGGTAAFSRIPAHELFGLTISSENLFRSAELNEILERLAEARSNRDRVDVVEAFLRRKLTNTQPVALISNAIQLIKQQSGIIRIRDLAISLHISQDAFEKRFRTLIGSTPKQYASIIRLRNLIGKYPSYHSLTEASYEAGYFDQSHFIKEFRLFTGRAPKDFFKSTVYW
jgi:AraC-like DNA-binding protein